MAEAASRGHSDRPDFGPWLLRTRLSCSYTLARFALVSGTTEQTVAEIERGQYPPSADLRERFVAVLAGRF